jgi:hypothetical protein
MLSRIRLLRILGMRLGIWDRQPVRRRQVPSERHLRRPAVALVHLPIAAEIGRSFAAHVRSEPAAQRLWVRARGDGVELWLVTAPTDPETVYRLHEAGVRAEAQFPDFELCLHVLNARNYSQLDPSTSIPTGAVEVPLRPE